MLVFPKVKGHLHFELWDALHPCLFRWICRVANAPQFSKGGLAGHAARDPVSSKPNWMKCPSGQKDGIHAMATNSTTEVDMMEVSMEEANLLFPVQPPSGLLSVVISWRKRMDWIEIDVTPFYLRQPGHGMPSPNSFIRRNYDADANNSLSLKPLFFRSRLACHKSTLVLFFNSSEDFSIILPARC
jgi:hypothetical protein